MSIPVIVDVAIGLVVVYYIMGLIVSFFVSQVKQGLEMKGRDLYKVLKDTLGKHYQDVLGEELVTRLEPIKVPRLTQIVRGIKSNIIAKFTTVDLTPYVEKLPIPTLATQILKSYVSDTDKNKKQKVIGALINPAFDDIEAMAQQANADILEIEKEAQKKIEGWLDGVLERASDLYAQNVRRVVIFVALAVTLVLNVDTIAIGTYFYNEPTAREAAVRLMDKIYAEAEIDDTTGEIKVPDKYQDQIDELTALDIPMWWGASAPEGGFWSRFFGLLITWMAVSQGSSFWYDALKKLKGVRTKVKSIEEESSA